MKGISLAIETIIFIILAVTVLSVLLLFFTKTGGSSQTRVELEANRNIYCGNYISGDLQCKTDGKSITVLDTKKFSETCGKLGVKGCPAISPECFSACCGIVCPKK
jgi:hypothetical protein